MKVADTRSSNSITGVYNVNTFTICWDKQKMIKARARHHVYRLRRLNISGWWTCAVVRAAHMLQIAWASASVFFLICRSCAACTRGSRVSFAPQSASSFSTSHSSNCQTLYLKALDKHFRLNQGPVNKVQTSHLFCEGWNIACMTKKTIYCNFKVNKI